MRIDRKRARRVFQEYVEGYDCSDELVRLKIEHTYRVSDLCEMIARSLLLCGEDVELAWLLGLLHDIGRFEQIKNYGTFIDAESIDHAQYGADILFSLDGEQGIVGEGIEQGVGQGKIRDYIEYAEEDLLIKTVVACHSSFRIPDKLDARTRMFCNILRDADKIDILKVNVDFPLEEIYHVTTQELRNSQVSRAVLDSFEEEHAILRSLKQTAVDYVVGHISLVYELVFPVSLSIVKKQGCLDKLMNFESRNAVTCKQFEGIRQKMGNYIDGKGTFQ